MVIGIFSYADDLSGGNYRLVRTLSLFPSGKFVLLMPQDRFEIFKAKVSTLNRNGFLNILKGTIILPPFAKYGQNIYGIIKYASIISKVAKEHGIDFIYFPYGNQYFTLAFRIVGVRWTQLLQQSPVVGSLISEDGHGFGLFRKNLKLNLGYNDFKVLKSYARLLTLKLSASGIYMLSVSESIPYELEKLGIKLNIITVNPGNGVDKCDESEEKDIDLIYYARIIPQKGIYDFLKAVKAVNPKRTVVAGFATKEMEEQINDIVAKLDSRVELMVNLTRKESMQLLMRSKVFVYPTRLDAFPLVVLEALSCGTAVVSYSVPAIRMNYMTEAVAKVRPMDLEALIAKIKEVLKNDLWVDMGKDGKAYAAKYTWENVARSEWNILQKLHSTK